MTKTIRVLHICGSITSSGGVGSFLMNYYKSIDKEKVQFDFLTHNATEESLLKEINTMGGNVYKITSKSESIIKNIIEACRFINKKSSHDIIHIHTASTTSFMYLLIAKIAKKRIRIVHSHSTDLEKPKRSLQHRLHKILQPIMLSLATDLFACSTAAGEWLFGYKMIDKVNIINNAIDTKRFKYSEVKSKNMKEKMHLDSKLVIGNIGRFVHAKNHDFLIDIFKELVKINPNSILLLIGDGELRNEIRKKVSNLKLTNNVQFLGIRKDIPDLLQVMDIFLLPSRYEGLPVVLIEAQASGLQIFTTDTITEEVELTDLVTRLSLNKGPRYWAEKISSNHMHRSDYSQDIIESGYDINNNSKWLEKFYLK